ncbi:MAG: hypothetical protein A2Z78_01810 [Candidatus Nealsonbacteria bacterium RBG_13_36_15]|uniref:Uncharacterized protein n=1 Tax=Candidatus Nealsonbacteria bacterium RBG_13_36_15 TaxID=1801660 RepID=A0A1G2DXY7_9BACT|nr:MAG: hypothetical protein A2Z78_01810 [Candidatus Nealsonbacteria bacterium RBG_13_36_15]
MKFTTKKPKESITTLARKLGYIPKEIVGDEFNLVRQIRGNKYPRFHLYLKEDRERNLLFLNLHLDQKRPSYVGTPAHGGEYTGKVVEDETERIKQIIENM